MNNNMNNNNMNNNINIEFNPKNNIKEEKNNINENKENQIPGYKVWYTNYRGYIVKSTLELHTNRIREEKIPYNHPNTFLNFLDNYFKNELN